MKAKKFFLNLFSNIGSQIIILGFGIILPKLLIVNLGSETNGLIASVGQIYAYVGLLEAGIGATVIQALYKPISENDRMRVSEILSASNHNYKKIGVLYIVGIVLVAICYPQFIDVELPQWKVICIIIFSGLGNAINFLLQQNFVTFLLAEGKGYIITITNTVINIISSLAKAVLLMLHYDVVIVLLCQFLITLIRIVVIKAYIKEKYSWIDLHSHPDFTALNRQKNVFIQQISYFVYSNTDILILTIFCNLKLVSVYSLYLMIIGAVEGIVASFTNSIVFALGQLYNEDKNRFKKMYQTFETVYITIIFAAFSVTYIIITPFLKIYTSGITDVNYIDEKLAFLFIVMKMVSSLRSQSQNVVGFAGMFRETQNSAILEAVLNIILSITLVNLIGIYGVIIGSIISTLYRGIVVTCFCNKKILDFSTKETFSKLILFICYFIGFVIMSKACKLYVVYSSYFSLIISTIIISLISIVFWGIMFFIIKRNQFKDAIELIKPYIKKLCR